MTEDNIDEATRRVILKGAAGALGVSAAGAATGHPTGEERKGQGTTDSSHVDDDHEHGDSEGHTTENARTVGYHSIGGVGPASQFGRPEDAHRGQLTEIRTHGDLAAVGVYFANAPDAGRGMVLLDISDYTRAEDSSDLDNAELTVLSFVRNNNRSEAVMDVKWDDTGEYVFASTQPVAALAQAPQPTQLGVNPDDHSTAAGLGGVTAIDVSDPGNPEAVGSFDVPSTGIHNSFHHRIGGDDYVFAIKDVNAGDSGMYVLEFDRETGALEPVNFWTADGSLTQGEVGTDHTIDYIHDVEVHDDPRTGRPTAYVAYWDQGLWVLDASDPADLEELGQFPMRLSHFASTPSTLVPVYDDEGTVVDERRVAVASHEKSTGDRARDDPRTSNPEASGTVFLVDCEGIYPEDDAHDPDAEFPIELGELDNWTWLEPGDGTIPDDEAVDFTGYLLSPHNSDFTVYDYDDDGFTDPDTGESGTRREVWLNQAHYHGGVRFIRVEPGRDDGVTTAEAEASEALEDRHRATDWSLTERGFSQDGRDVPSEASPREGRGAVPNFWASVEANGITFSSGMNSGVYATQFEGEDGHPGFPISARPQVTATRDLDASVVFADGTTAVGISVDADQSVLLRDRLPEGFSPLVGDYENSYEAGASTWVEFGVGPDTDRVRYYAEAADSGGTREFGPLQFSADGGKTWDSLSAFDPVVVAGIPGI